MNGDSCFKQLINKMKLIDIRLKQFRAEADGGFQLHHFQAGEELSLNCPHCRKDICVMLESSDGDTDYVSFWCDKTLERIHKRQILSAIISADEYEGDLCVWKDYLPISLRVDSENDYLFSLLKEMKFPSQKIKELLNKK